MVTILLFFLNNNKYLIVKSCLTEKFENLTETKVGYSDPAILNGRVAAQQIKVTQGITG